MIYPHKGVQYVLTIGLVLAGGAMCFAQTDAPNPPPKVLDRTQQVDPLADERVRSDRPLAQDRIAERTVVQERVVERYREGEVYVGGFGGWTWGHDFDHVEGTGSLKSQTFGSLGLGDSVVYGGKMGYFLPGRLNWLGLEAEGFNSTPHIQAGSGLPGSHLRVTTLAFNVIARTKLGCRFSEHARDMRNDGQGSWSSLDDNTRCPLQLYAGVGPGIFFAETSNQFGRSSDNARVGLNALGGMKYFVNRQMAVFAEYKFNYAQFDFNQAQGQTAGLTGNYMASHVVGGLAWHF